MSLLFVPSANQISNLVVSASSQYLGSTLTFSISTQGYSTGDTIYYTTTGGGQQFTGTAVVTNYLGDLGTASIPITTSRTTSTSAFTATFYNGTTPVILSGGNPQATLSLIAPDPYFTATTLSISSAGPGPTALTDLSGTTSTIQVVGSPNVRSLIPFTTPGVSSSMYFNGNLDQVIIPANTNNAFGAGDFTIEFWMYTVAFTSPSARVLSQGTHAAGEHLLLIYPNGSFDWCGQVTPILAGSTLTGTFVQNTWQHVAITRSGTSMAFYVNGVSKTTATSSYNFSGVTQICVGGNTTTANQYLNGYISNLRITKGLAVYTGAFTTPTSPLQTTQSAGTNIAAITTQTVLLLLQSPPPPNNNSFSYSANTSTQTGFRGTPTSGTFSPYSLYANYFNGAVYQTIQASSATALGTGDFTIEFWAYPTVNQRQDWFDINNGTGPRLLVYYDISGSIIYYGNGATRITGSAMVLNTWQHIAVVRISGVTKLYINGTQSGSNYTDTINYPSQPLTVGKDSAGSTYVTGYIRNLRLIKGQGIYTAAFTPPTLTTQLAATINTSVLACQGPFGTTSTDYSTFTNTVTNAGSISARLISTTTFITRPYSTSTIGGSIYFNGTSDVVTSTNATSLTFGTSNFTVECWAYITVALDANEHDIIEANPAAGGFQIYIAVSSNGIKWGTYGSTSFVLTPVGSIPVNQWFHLAISRTGTGANQTFGFINGALTITTQDSNSYTGVGLGIGGRNSGANYFTGYLSGIRIVNGYAMYSSAFSPPLTPPTASLTGTTTIINGDNSAIYDATGFNNISTVNTASLVTTPVKFGSNSIQLLGNSYLNVVSSTGTSFGSIIGTADFTAEMWIYPTASGTPYLMAIGSEAAGRYVIYLVSGVLTTNYFGAGAVSMGGSIGTNYWTHIAVARQGSTIRGFINGVLQGTAETNSSSIGNNNIVKVGSDASGNSTFQGYMSDVRLTKGIARYTASFTTATTYLPLI